MYYPLFIDLKNKKILVIGGGRVGSRRALYLLEAGALVTVISKEFDKKLEIKNKHLKIIKKEINEKKLNEISLKNYFLVITATNDKKINEKITKKIKNRALVCRADNYKLGNVIFPAVLKVEKNTLAFTTFGKNPKLSKEVKRVLKQQYSTNL